MERQLVQHGLEEGPGAVAGPAARVDEGAAEVPEGLEGGGGLPGGGAAVEEEGEHRGVGGADQAEELEDLGSPAGECGEQGGESDGFFVEEEEVGVRGFERGCRGGR